MAAELITLYPDDPSPLPAIPAADTLVTPAQISNVGGQLVAYAKQRADVHIAKDIADRWAAITEYIRRQKQEGVAEAEACGRRLDMIIGDLLGPAKVGGVNGHNREEVAGLRPPLIDEVAKDERSRLRQMAAHPEIVDEVIEESTDAAPPTRNKVLQRIAEKVERSVQRAEQRKQLSEELAESSQRHESRLASVGYTAQQAAQDQARQKVRLVVIGVIQAIDELERSHSPGQVWDAVDNALTHVTSKLRADLHRCFSTIDKYQKAEP